MMAPSSPDATASLLPMRSSPAVGSDRNSSSATRPRNQCRLTVSRPSRIGLIAFENMDVARAAFASPAYMQARTIGEKYATLRIFALEGTLQ
jgi:hypothetical protein